MTVISTVISQQATAHASDSLVTVKLNDGTYKKTETRKTKVISVLHFRGIMSYWGLASVGNWKTLDYLKSVINQASQFSTAESFANDLAYKLNNELIRLRVNKGIGIHFTTYEYVSGYWVPELFLISNFLDTTYATINPQGFKNSRETYHTIYPGPVMANHGDSMHRLKVRQYLQTGILIYNNGDPEMFNPTAKNVFDLIKIASARNILVPATSHTVTAIARRPIEIVSNMQKDFYKSGYQVVGGRIHDISITPRGIYNSSSGDC